jgi:3-isopropylmalate dehydrogenase
MRHEVAYLRGGPDDESGPEMADAAMQVLTVLLGAPDSPAVDFIPVESGVHCYRAQGRSLPEASLGRILELGVAFKAPNASAKTPDERPTSLILRSLLGTFANVSYIRSFAGIKTALHPDVDVVVVRDNTEGLLGVTAAYETYDVCADLRVLTRERAERLARIACAMAAARRGRVTVCAFPVSSPTDRLFIAACERVAEEFPGVDLSVRKVDAFAGAAVIDPSQFDVVVAPQEWGSIMTDLLAATTGSVALAARANLGDNTAYFEPIHGTAPGKAGKGTVNPISQVLAGSLLLTWLGQHRADPSASRAGDRLRDAVARVLSTGDILTVDLGGSATTRDMADAICDALKS